MKPILFEDRRKRFFDTIEGGVAILFANAEVVRNDDVYYRFRQDSSFQYLTGFHEPEAIAVFRNIKGKKEFLLFVRPRDAEKEIWNGYRAGVEGAVSQYGADRAYNLSEFHSRFSEILTGAKTVYGTMASSNSTSLLELLERFRKVNYRSQAGLLPVQDVRVLIAEMRIVKTEPELDRMRRAAQITAKAHEQAMARCRPGLNEGQIEALVEYCFRDAGASSPGYTSIVAGGANSTILHYVENKRVLEAGGLLLIDAGAELDCYTADLTRTFPVNGRFSTAQKRIYAAVLDVQKACIAHAKPGTSLQSLHTFAVEQLTEAMIELKLLTGDRDELIAANAHKRFYPHGTGHMLGMDVHDCGVTMIDNKARPLTEGMVFTIEPGMYIQPGDTEAPEEYRGIGVRIEDDILMTATGCEVLTAGAPKEITDIEALVGSLPWLKY